MCKCTIRNSNGCSHDCRRLQLLKWLMYLWISKASQAQYVNTPAMSLGLAENRPGFRIRGDASRGLNLLKFYKKPPSRISHKESSELSEIEKEREQCESKEKREAQKQEKLGARKAGTCCASSMFEFPKGELAVVLKRMLAARSADSIG